MLINSNFRIKIIKLILLLLQKIYSNTIWLFYQRNTIHCIGDSHVRVFKTISYMHFWRKTIFKFCIVWGATISGLSNPNSRTQAGPIFKKYLKKVKKSDIILLCLGEVDCWFVLWYKHEKYRIPVQQYTKIALDQYKSFILDLRKRGFKKIIICSVVLPTISDNDKEGIVANFRSKIKANYRERTLLTLYFNRKIREIAKKNKIIFLDYTEEIKNKNNPYLNNYYKNKNPHDHHLDDIKLGKVLIKKLIQLKYE